MGVGLFLPSRSPPRALPTETKVESGTSQSKSGTSINLGTLKTPQQNQECGDAWRGLASPFASNQITLMGGFRTARPIGLNEYVGTMSRTKFTAQCYVYDPLV